MVVAQRGAARLRKWCALLRPRFSLRGLRQDELRQQRRACGRSLMRRALAAQRLPPLRARSGRLRAGEALLLSWDGQPSRRPGDASARDEAPRVPTARWPSCHGVGGEQASSCQGKQAAARASKQLPGQRSSCHGKQAGATASKREGSDFGGIASIAARARSVARRHPYAFRARAWDTDAL
eukprot:gene6598-biopygen9241